MSRYKMEDRYAYYLALKYPNFRHKLTNKIKTEVVAFLWLKKWPQDHVNSELMDLIQEVYYAHKLYCIHFNTPIADKMYNKILCKFPKLVSLVERS